MIKKHFRLLAFLFTCVFAVTSTVSAFATETIQETTAVSTTETIEGWPAAPSIQSNAAVLIEADTGTVLYDKNMNMQCYPASITKIMTAILGIESCSLNDMVYFSEENIAAVPRDSSHIAINPGEELSMENCLYGLLLASANECANAIAEHVSGSIPAFTDLMNERAQELGATNTHFANANGLPDENHYTTCYDMAMISRAAVSNDTYCHINGTTAYMIPPTNLQPESRPVNTQHGLLIPGTYHYDGCFGGKTGYTTVAGSTLVSFAEHNGMTLICVVMQSSSPSTYIDSTALFDYGFNYFKKVNVSQNETRYHFDNSTFFPSSYSIFDDAPLNIQLNQEDVIVLPISADFSDAEASLTFSSEESGSNGNETSSTLAFIDYSYQEHYVGSASLDALYSDQNTFSFTQTTAEPETSEEDTTGIAADAPSHVIRINTRYLIAGVVLLLLLGIYLVYRSCTRVERDRRKRIRRQQRRQFGSYSRLNMLTRRRSRRRRGGGGKLKF